MKIALHPYANEWPVIFRYEEHVLLRALDIPGLIIEHIGSTAVPGLSAKPVIDIVVGIPCDHSLDMVIEPLLGLGYVYVRHYENLMPERRFFIRFDDDTQLDKKIIQSKNDLTALNQPEHAYIHVVHEDNSFLSDTIKFRDHLRHNPSDKLVYELLKKQLAENEWNNINDYVKAKSDFIKMILSRPSLQP